jgi:hypothetical protein
MVFTERVTSITQDKFVPSVVDAILNSNVLTQRTLGRSPKVWSGETLRRPVQIAKSVTGGSFSGADKFSVATSQTRIKMSFEPKGFYQSATIIGIEKAVNKTEAQVLSLIKVTLEEAENSALDSIGDINFGGGAGNDFEGLGNTVDDGTTYDSYGAQSRATYTALKGTVTASGGTMTLTKLANLWTAISAAGSGKQKPTIGICDETVWNLYESLLAPAVVNNYQSFGLPMVNANTAPGMAVQNPDGLKGTQGFVSITYRGMPIVADEKADSGVMFFLNEHYLDWYSLKDEELNSVQSGGSVIDGVYSDGKGATPFQWTGFKVPTDQYVAVGQLIAMGNLVSFNPRRHGKLTGITTV